MVEFIPPIIREHVRYDNYIKLPSSHYLSLPLDVCLVVDVSVLMCSGPLPIIRDHVRYDNYIKLHPPGCVSGGGCVSGPLLLETTCAKIIT